MFANDYTVSNERYLGATFPSAFGFGPNAPQVVAESIIIKQQLLVINRPHGHAPNAFSTGSRLLFLGPRPDIWQQPFLASTSRVLQAGWVHLCSVYSAPLPLIFDSIRPGLYAAPKTKIYLLDLVKGLFLIVRNARPF